MFETSFKQPGQGLCPPPLVRTRLVRILRALRLESLALHARRVLRKRKRYVEFRFQARRCRAFREKLGLIHGLAAYVKCQRDDDASAPIKPRQPRL